MKALGLWCAAALFCAACAASAPLVAAQEQREGQQAEEKSETRAGDDAKRGKLKIEPGQRYLLLSTMKTSTMQKELDAPR